VTNVMRFQNRREAGQYLGTLLRGRGYARARPIVLALPRGGVPVGYEVARALRAPLDVWVVRKLGTPGHEELALGAVASGGVRVINEEVVDELDVPADAVDAIATRELLELERRELAYRGGRPPPLVRGRVVILVDDGLATGATMRAAVAAVRREEPARVVVAVPVAALETYGEFQHEVDDVVCAFTPEPFHAVGLWYLDFAQTDDAEVCDLLARAAHRLAVRSPALAAPPH
jgi:putative phosphoribosyl transferase